MTDITDQDRRDARQWAEAIGRSDAPCAADLWHAASRYILATVDAPATTLAEELARIAENSPVWTIRNVCDELKSAAARAEKMERELDDTRAEVDQLEAAREVHERMYREARAEVERVTRERERSLAQVQGLARRESDLTSEVRMLTDERDEAQDAVERLTAERDRIASGRYITYAEVDGKPVQKGAESNAESIDPADVPAGEAWLVECRGERRNAVKDRDDNNEPWNTIDANGRYVYKRNENVTLVSRLVPAPRVITNPDELDQLGHRTVILSTDGQADVYQKDSNGEWLDVTSHGYPSRRVISMENAVTVLWEPEA